MSAMYQRNDDPSYLPLDQAFTNAKPSDIIKTMPYCEHCMALSQGDTSIQPARLMPQGKGFWVHDIDINGAQGTVICTRYGV